MVNIGIFKEIFSQFNHLICFLCSVFGCMRFANHCTLKNIYFTQYTCFSGTVCIFIFEFVFVLLMVLDGSINSRKVLGSNIFGSFLCGFLLVRVSPEVPVSLHRL